MSNIDRMLEKITTARKAIVDKHGEYGIKHLCASVVSSMPCPVCETGTLEYSISSHNGHIHGRCTTDGCARWME